MLLKELMNEQIISFGFMSRFSSLVRIATVKVLRVPKTRSDVSALLTTSGGTYGLARWLGPAVAPTHPSLLCSQNLLGHTISTQKMFDALELLNQVLKF